MIALLTCSVLLTSCSKKIEEGSYDSANEQQAVNVDPSIDQEQTKSVDSESSEQDLVPLKEDKPKAILPNETSTNESIRKMVREASVNFTTKDIVKTALSIDKMTYEAGGFVEQKDIDFHVVDKQSQNIADGKIKIFEKVDPIAVMTVRVPSERAAAFVNQLLPLMFFLDQQQYSAKRYELKLLEEKIVQTQIIPNSTKNSQLDEISKLTKLEVEDRVRYSTIKIYMTQPTMIRERLDTNIDAVARLNSDGFWQRSWSGILSGWQFVLDFIVIAVTIWPFYIIIFFIYILYCLVKPLLNKDNS